MVKIDRIQLCNACIPPFVFGVALLAWLLLLHQAVESMPIGDVFRNLLVTILAQSGLGCLVIGFVAVAAFTLVFHVPLYYLARHQKIIGRISMCLDGKGKDGQRARLDECQFHAMVGHLIFMNRNYVPDRTEYQHVNQRHVEYMP